MSAEAESVGHGYVHLDVSRSFRYIVQVAFRIRGLQVQCLVKFIMFDGQNANDGFNGTGSSQQMACLGFGGVNPYDVGMFTKRVVNGLGLVFFVQAG